MAIKVKLTFTDYPEGAFLEKFEFWPDAKNSAVWDKAVVRNGMALEWDDPTPGGGKETVKKAVQKFSRGGPHPLCILILKSFAGSPAARKNFKQFDSLEEPWVRSLNYALRDRAIGGKPTWPLRLFPSVPRENGLLPKTLIDGASPEGGLEKNWVALGSAWRNATLEVEVRQWGKFLVKKLTTPTEWRPYAQKLVDEEAARAKKSRSKANIPEETPAAKVKAAGSQKTKNVPPDTAAPLAGQRYLERIAGLFKTLHLRGIHDAKTLEIDLEKVYVALKAAPWTDEEMTQSSRLNEKEVREMADVDEADESDPEAWARYEAQNVRETARPKQEAARLTPVPVKTLGDAFRRHRRLVILGGPGSGKTTLGRWLVLQFAQAFAAQKSGRRPAMVEVLASQIDSEIEASGPRRDREKIAAEIDRLQQALRGTPTDSTQNARLKLAVLQWWRASDRETEGYRLAQEIKKRGSKKWLRSPPAASPRETAATASEPQRAASNSDADVEMRWQALWKLRRRRVATRQEAKVKLGPARFPIFLRIAHFARHLAECKAKSLSHPSLETYLGTDADANALDDGLSAQQRHDLFIAHLEARRAIVVLDGLDELAEANRQDVALAIQTFIRERVDPDSDDERLSPWRSGGNQVVVTSRIYGYKNFPLAVGAAHFAIQDMSRYAVGRFVDSWTDAVNARLRDAPPPQRPIVAQALLEEIYNETRPKIAELASNPLRVTILAIVYWKDRKLPEQPAALYDRIVSNLIRIWLERPECKGKLTREDLLAALEPLAARMLEKAGLNGVIGAEDLLEEMSPPLARRRKTTVDDPAFVEERDALLTIIREHVGLLAQTSQGNYEFYHRTIQEFLAARHLLADKGQARERLIAHLENPLWRQTLLLALGWLTLDEHWTAQKRAKLFGELLATDDARPAYPHATLLVATAAPELGDTLPEVWSDVTRRLLLAYRLSRGLRRSTLREQIMQAFQKLKAGRQSAAVAKEWLAWAKRPDDKGEDFLGAIAELAVGVDWFTTDLVEVFIQQAHRDSATHGWPLQQALHTCLGRRPKGVPWLKPVPALDHARLLRSLPMREFLEADPAMVAWIRADTDWLWLMVALFGGTGQVGLLPRYQKLQEARVNTTLEREAAYPEESEIKAIERLAERGQHAPNEAYDFEPGDIVHDLADSELSEEIRDYLRSRRPARHLKDFLRERLTTGVVAESVAEAALAMASLGEEDIMTKVSPPHRDGVILRFQRLLAEVDEPLIRSCRALPLGAAPDEQRRFDLVQRAMRQVLAAGAVPLRMGLKIPEWPYNFSTQSPEIEAAQNAELWSYRVAGNTSDDDVYTTAVTIDTIGRRLTRPSAALIDSFAAVAQAVNNESKQRIRWSQAVLPPRADSLREKFFAMLDSLATMPPRFDFFGAFLLAGCRPFCASHPELIPEIIGFARSCGSYFLGSLADDWASADGETDLISLEVYARAIKKVRSPYLEFRARWRFGPRSPALVDRARALLGRIVDPQEATMAMEWLLRDLWQEPAGFFQVALARAAQISDPENRARALGRLAFLRPNSLPDQIPAIREALAKIPDERRRAQTISEFRAAFPADRALAETLDAAARMLRDPWERSRALALDVPLIQAYRAAIEDEKLTWGLVYLRMLALEVIGLGGANESDWSALAAGEGTAAVANLMQAGAEHGLPVSSAQAAVLERRVVENSPALRGLWGILERPDRGALRRIRGWPYSGVAGAWAALVQLEAGAIVPATIGPVVDLLLDDDDRLRARAALALHGPTPYTSNKSRRWSVWKVGREVIELVGRLRLSESLPPRATVLGLVSHDLHHDHRDAVDQWLREAQQGSAGGAVAREILRSIESASGEVIERLIEALFEVGPDVQREIVYALCRLAHCQKNDFNQWDERVGTALRQVRPDLLVQIIPRYIRPEPILLTASAALPHFVRSAGWFTQFKAKLAALKIGLTLSDDPAASIGSVLAGMGSHFYADGEGGNRRLAHGAAAACARKAEVLQLLLAVFETKQGPRLDPDTASDVLVTIEALVSQSQELELLFANTAAPSVWEPLLVEAARNLSWSGRLSSVLLLSQLRHVTQRTAEVLRAAIKDEAEVQVVAYAAAGKFRRLGEGFVEALLPGLEDPSAAVVASTIRLLTSLAKNEVALSVTRRQILDAFQRAVSRPSAQRFAYMIEVEKGERVKLIDRLDNLFYAAIIEISAQ